MLTRRGWIISSGVVGVALVVPLTMNISVAGAQNLKPLFFINIIVFFLAASALFTHHHDPDHHLHLLHHYYSSLEPHPPTNSAFFDHYYNNTDIVLDEENSPAEDLSPPVPPEKPVAAPLRPAGLRRTPTPTAPTFDDLPPASGRNKSEEERESMEDTWEKIKAEKHLTKSDTWHGGGSDASGEGSSSWLPRSAPPSPSPYAGKKTAGMFIERIPTWLRIKKEPSMGVDELNARFEAFIKKFQDDIRLQRLESLRRYKSKLLKRGVYKR